MRFIGIPTWTCFSTFTVNVFINDLCNVIKHCQYLLFADDVITFHTTHSLHSYILLQSDTEHIQYCCTANCVILNCSKTEVIDLTRKQMFFIILTNYIPLYNLRKLSNTLQYTSIQNTISTTRRLYFLPFHQEAGFHIHCNLTFLLFRDY
jgi:hypothetical protein